MRIDHRQRLKQNSMMALDKVPVSPFDVARVKADSAQPSSEESRELHDLMLKMIDHDVSDINGEKVVQMRDTEVRHLQLLLPVSRATLTGRQCAIADPNGAADVPTRPKSARQSFRRDLDAPGIRVVLYERCYLRLSTHALFISR